MSAQEQAQRLLANDLATRALGIEISDVVVGRATAVFRGRSRSLRP